MCSTSTPMDTAACHFSFGTGMDSAVDSGYITTTSTSSFSTGVTIEREVLSGRKYVDFFYYLMERNRYQGVLEMILKELSVEDLNNAAKVSTTWYDCIMSIPQEASRLRRHRSFLNDIKENIGSGGSVCRSICDRGDLIPQSRHKKALNDIQNLLKDGKNDTSLPSRNEDAESNPQTLLSIFQKAGEGLKPGSYLLRCFKCCQPACVDDGKLAHCVNKKCATVFCAICQSEIHPGRECRFISTPVVRRNQCMINSKRSKRNLRRLLM